MFTTLTCLAALSFSIGGYFMKLSGELTQFRSNPLTFFNPPTAMAPLELTFRTS